jgi:hypothetical protein
MPRPGILAVDGKGGPWSFRLVRSLGVRMPRESGPGEMVGRFTLLSNLFLVFCTPANKAFRGLLLVLDLSESADTSGACPRYTLEGISRPFPIGDAKGHTVVTAEIKLREISLQVRSP